MTTQIKHKSIRIKLNDIISNSNQEKKILENIKYCKNIVGHRFKVIFWNEELDENIVKDFVKRNEKILFEINTEITKNNANDNTWFLIDSDGDASVWRYKWTGDILSGIAEFLKIVKNTQQREDK